MVFVNQRYRGAGFAAIKMDDTFYVVGNKVSYKSVATAEGCRFENSTMVCKELENAPVSYGSTQDYKALHYMMYCC